ncbi:MAG TPA: hypothetical protein VMZ31_16335 [Phycisphaerae bacterium]|nr:hypothetical protein [Phycisphaerae bacterium]
MISSARSSIVGAVAASAAVLAVAAFVRVAPLAVGGDRLQRQCVTEDGYLMLTVARNLAMGKGLSVADGHTPTNGVQPLATWIFAAFYWITHGHKLDTLYIVVGFQFLIATATAVLLLSTVRTQLYRGPAPWAVACLAALLWYVSPTSIQHSQNSLETALYVLLILASAVLYDRFTPRLAATLAPTRCAALGALLGLTFLARNDAVFLIAAMLAVHLATGLRQRAFPRRLAQGLIVGSVSVLTALPWLMFNYSRFGSVMPVSGQAESIRAGLGANLPEAMTVQLETMLVIARVPATLQMNPIFQIICAGSVLALTLLAAWHRRWLAENLSVGLLSVGLYAVALLAFYGLWFGAPHFLGRYLFPPLIVFAVVLAALIVRLWQRPPRALPWSARMAIGLLAALWLIAVDMRLYLHGTSHEHFQVVDWVEHNVPDNTWVAAVQTGTLGYYHDRTINLDGKVNPQALAARRANTVPQYVADGPARYIVDWAGLIRWRDIPTIDAHFELIEHDASRNLAVFRRRATSAGRPHPDRIPNYQPPSHTTQTKHREP